jgi:hypothetical protein
MGAGKCHERLFGFSPRLLMEPLRSELSAALAPSATLSSEHTQHVRLVKSS